MNPSEGSNTVAANPYAAPSANLEERATTAVDLYAVAIGPHNTDFYLRYLRSAPNGEWKPSWNWPAFLVFAP